jgi:glycosidase
VGNRNTLKITRRGNIVKKSFIGCLLLLMFLFSACENKDDNVKEVKAGNGILLEESAGGVQVSTEEAVYGAKIYIRGDVDSSDLIFTKDYITSFQKGEEGLEISFNNCNFKAQKLKFILNSGAKEVTIELKEKYQSRKRSDSDIIVHAKYSHIWAWNKNGAAGNLFSSWPGEAMTDEGNTWYKYTFYEAYSLNLLFSNSGNDKTSDLSITASGEYWYNGEEFLLKNPDEEEIGEIGIYIHKNFANGIYAWVDSSPVFEPWPGKTDLIEYGENSDYYEVLVTDYSAFGYLLLKDGNKVTAEDQSASIGYVTWEEDGSIVEGKPISDNELKIEVSPIKSIYGESDTVSIKISGGNVTSRNAVLGNENISFVGDTASFVVGNYLNNKETKVLVVTGENEETGSKTLNFNIYREDNTVKVVEDIDELRIYQVMVCSFMDGDPWIGYDWQWAGYRANGDLQGIIDSLDYIKSMNFNAIWMTPIFHTYSGSQAHNGYFTNDYFNVDPNFGTNDKLKELIEKAHAIGINIILDGVLGHNDGDNIAASPLSGVVPSTSNPVNYQDGGATLQYYKDVVYHWIREYKIDGWRFDQSYQLGPGDGGSHKGQGGSNFYWDDIREVVERATAENRAEGNRWGVLGYTVGEDWEGEYGITQNTYGTNERGLHSAFDFPTRYRLVQTLAREEYGKEVGGADNLNYSHDAYPDWAHPNLMIGNHDLARFGDLINYSSTHNNNYWKRHKAAIAFMGAYSGPITLYYGEEWGSKTGNSDLTTMHVSRNDGKITGFSYEEENLRQYASKIMEIRSQYSSLWQEDTRRNLKASGNQYVDLKYDPSTGEKIVFCLNIGTYSETFYVNEGSSYTDLISGQEFNTNSIPMDGLQARYLLVK